MSDDDYARVAIAETFVHAPRLDPSQTSWLPFPFWLLGGSMAVFGRSLVVARVTSMAASSALAALPYVVLRLRGDRRFPALVFTGLAFVSPWQVWLGAATVPESYVASLTAAGVLALGTAAPAPRLRAAGAVFLGLACLSRYEAWPVALGSSLYLAVKAGRTARGEERRSLAAFAVATIAGPALWMLWNRATHGDLFHFFHRVANFKRALGASTDPRAALLLYPKLLVMGRPELCLAAVAAGAIAFWRGTLRPWWLPLSCVLLQVLMLAVGNARDGAPAHHAERALLVPWMLIAAFAAFTLADASGIRRSSLQWRLLAAVAALGIAALWVSGARVLWTGPFPGHGEGEDRAEAIATGLKLRGARSFTVTPCAYEHFAVIAAFGAPEKVTVAPRAPAPTCPAITDVVP